MSKDDKYRFVLSNLDSKSATKVHNALGYIRAKLIKEKDGVEKLCRFNIVKIVLRLLEIIDEDGDKKSDLTSDTFWKQADLCLSILSNMCMEKCTRNAVKNVPDSISTLVALLQDQEKASINNRTIRTLANLALDPAICQDIVKTPAVQHVVDFMNVTEDKECLKTCCRALRLFGYSDKNRDKIAALVGIYPVARLLKHEDNGLMEYGLRALSELSRKCTLQCASQIQNAGVVDKIVELAEEEGKWNNNNFAIKIFMNLMEQPNARASVGSSGGIAFVLKLLEEEHIQTKRLPLLNALCLFCRESVNRVRIREKGILDIFAKALQDETLAVLHARIISAIVCFIYDEKGLKHLLSLSLVDILLKHLQSFAKFSSSINASLMKCTEIEFDLSDSNAVETCSRKRHLESPEKLDLPEKKVCSLTVIKQDFFDECVTKEMRDTTVYEGMQNPSNDRNFKETVDSLPMDDLCVVENLSSHVCLETDNSYNETNDFKLSKGSRLNTGPSNDDGNSKLMETETTKDYDHEEQPGLKNRNHVYSLDSPTYEAQYSEWSMEDFKSSVKCKQSFSPDSLSQRSGSPSRLSVGSSPLYTEPMSPLSISSHYSPDYSPQYSPLKVAFLSPASSPGRASTSSYLASPHRSISPSEFSDTPDLVGLGTVEETAGLWEYSSDEDCAITGQYDACKDSEGNSLSSSIPGSKKSTDDDIFDKSNKGDEPSDILNAPSDVVAKDVGSRAEPCSITVNEPPSTVAGANNLSYEVKSDIHNAPKESETICYNPKTATNVESAFEPPETVSNVESTSNTTNTVRNVGSTSDTTKNVKNVEATSDSPKNVRNVETAKSNSDGDTSKTAKNIDKKETVRKATIDNILILFSRVSQMPDPRALVSETFICCLLDYVTTAENASPRASRILQRLMRNPLCLENLLDVLTPVYIVQKIHGDKLPITIPKSSAEVSCETKARNHLFRIRSGSISDMDDLDDSTDAIGNEDGNVNNALLQDLSFVVESPYGRGTIAHILKRKPQNQKLRCLLCLPFLCRNSTAQQRTLFQDEALHQLLNPKVLRSSLDFLRVTVLGLQFLSSYCKIQLKLPSCEQPFPLEEKGQASSLNNTTSVKDPQPSEKVLNLSDCLYALCRDNHDLVFVLDKDIKVTASKSVLVAVSPVFEAMLEGDYTESRQSQIRIPHISPEAFEFLLHFLHGCAVTCKVIHIIVSGECSFNGFCDAMSLADRYLLEDLQYYLVCLARQKYLNISTLKQLYHFAVLHSEVLAEDCIRYFLTQDANIEQRMVVFKDFLSGTNADNTLEHFQQVLKCHIYGSLFQAS